MSKAVVTLTAILLTTAAAADAFTNASGTWMPGRIGNVVMYWKVPKSATLAHHGKSWRFTVTYHGAKISGIANAQRKVYEAETKSPLLTYRGIHVGSRLADARAALGPTWRLFDFRSDATCSMSCERLLRRLPASETALLIDPVTKTVTGIEVSFPGD